MNRWFELLARLGRALFEVAAAEVAALADELKVSARRLLGALAVLVAAAQLALLGLGLLVLALVRALERWLEPWAAAALPGAILLVVALGFAVWSWRRMQTVELPSKTVERRWHEHEDWWRRNLLPEDEAGPGDADEP